MGEGVESCKDSSPNRSQAFKLTICKSSGELHHLLARRPVNILRNLSFSKGDYSKVRHQPPKKHWTKLHSYRAKVMWAQSRKELTQGSKVTNIEATVSASCRNNRSRGFLPTYAIPRSNPMEWNT